MRQVLTIAAALVGLAAHAVQPSPHVNDFVRAYVSTKRCMTNVGLVQHGKGLSPSQVQYFMIDVCSGPLVEVLLRDYPVPETKVLIMRIARTTYYEDVLRVKEPPLQNPANIVGK